MNNNPPYFVYPALQALKDCTDDKQRRELEEFIAANVGMPEVLASIIGPISEDIATFYNCGATDPLSTEATIDSFIARFGSGAPVQQEMSLREDLVMSEEEMMEKAKKLVKKREYGSALEIMETIYLNNPKKSVYFADQIRFVRKLMINESKKQS